MINQHQASLTVVVSVAPLVSTSLHIIKIASASPRGIA